MKDEDQILIVNLPIYAEDYFIDNGYVFIEDGKIAKVGLADDGMTYENENIKIIELDNTYKLIPGMIDLHIHGAAGADTMDATEEALHTIAAVLPKEGTTSFLATTMTTQKKLIEEALKNAANYISNSNKPGEAEIVGLHLEGPFISPNRAGAQKPDDIIEPNIELFECWQQLSGGNIKLVTIAPEREGGLQLVSYLRDHQVVASIGHSDAVYEQVVAAIDAGVTHATHLFNGMRPLHHREPGVVGAVLLHDEIKSEMIVDGIHIDPNMVKLAYKNKGSDHIFLVTDAMRAKCLGKGVYELGGQEVIVDGERATLRNGTLAGSILKLNHAAKNMMKFTGCDLPDIIQMTAVNPAKELNIFDRKGSIKEGKDADLVILNEENDVVMTFCRGKLAYTNLEGVTK